VVVTCWLQTGEWGLNSESIMALAGVCPPMWRIRAATSADRLFEIVPAPGAKREVSN
jgi:hypothetical protein